MTNNNDFIIDNNTGQQVRIDIQEALQQLASNNFGTNPPVTTATPPVQVAFPHQWFANGDTGKLMYKDASTGNNAETNYFNLANLNGGLFVDQTSTFNGSVIFNGTSASSGTITFDPTETNGLGALKFTSGSNCFFGDSNQFSIGHLGSIGGFIGSSVGTVFINGKATGGAFPYGILIQTANSDGGLDSAYRAYDDGRQELFFGGVSKFETSADGIKVTGSINATAQPACLLIDPVDTDITSSNESTPIKFNTQQTNVGCTVNTDKDRITVPSSGTYLISVCLSGIKTNATSDTDRILKILKNGNDAVNKDAFPRDPFGTSRNNESFSHTITMPLVLSANDYLELCFEGVDNALATVKFGYFSVTKLH